MQIKNFVYSTRKGIKWTFFFLFHWFFNVMINCNGYYRTVDLQRDTCHEKLFWKKSILIEQTYVKNWLLLYLCSIIVLEGLIGRPTITIYVWFNSDNCYFVLISLSSSIYQLKNFNFKALKIINFWFKNMLVWLSRNNN